MQFLSQIQITNLSFRHPGQTEYIFKDVNLTLDTNWKLGLMLGEMGVERLLC